MLDTFSITLQNQNNTRINTRLSELLADSTVTPIPGALHYEGRYPLWQFIESDPDKGLLPGFKDLLTALDNGNSLSVFAKMNWINKSNPHFYRMTPLDVVKNKLFDPELFELLLQEARYLGFSP